LARRICAPSMTPEGRVALIAEAWVFID
jgi:hypothetical protein